MRRAQLEVLDDGTRFGTVADAQATPVAPPRFLDDAAALSLLDDDAIARLGAPVDASGEGDDVHESAGQSFKPRTTSPRRSPS